MKIYVVTEGEYSDYHICSVFTDYHKAELYCALHTSYDDYEIEEYDTEDVKIDGDIKLYYGICFDIRNFNETIHFRRGIIRNKPIIEKIIKHNYSIFCIIPTNRYYNLENKEKAEKIIIDWYAKYKAESGEE